LKNKADMDKNTFLSKSRMKVWVTILHIAAFIVFVIGISIIYCNENFNRGLLWINAEKYDDSPAFRTQFDSDISLLFSYANLKNIFETDGKFDINKDIFGLNMGPSNDVDFTVGAIIEYAKRHGFYIDEHYLINFIELNNKLSYFSVVFISKFYSVSISSIESDGNGILRVSIQYVIFIDTVVQTPKPLT